MGAAAVRKLLGVEKAKIVLLFVSLNTTLLSGADRDYILVNHEDFCMEPEHEEYKGHRIELRPREAAAATLRAEGTGGESKPELLIDNAPIQYGQFPDGTYFLREYAYDPTDNLMELARRFIDYRSKVDEIRQERQSNGGD